VELDGTLNAPSAAKPAAAHGDLRAAVWPFVVSRVLADASILFLHRGRASWLRGGFAAWDGRWYSRIAAYGYPGLVKSNHQTGWAFAPLLPLLMATGRLVGLATAFTGVLISHAAFFAALVGLNRLLRRHCSLRATSLAVWTLALYPTAVVFSMVYPSAVFVALSVWAFVLLDERDDLAAGLCAAGAALTRPNGLWVAFALAVAVSFDRKRLAALCGPTVAALAGWMLFDQVAAGNALRFLTAKSVWHEVTLFNFFNPFNRNAVVHLALAALLLVALLVERHHLPRSWTLFTLAYVLPSLALGIVGIGRYASDCFPCFAAAGNVLERQPAAVRAVILVTLAIAQIAFTYWILRVRHLP
jgi:hypothetical protein